MKDKRLSQGPEATRRRVSLGLKENWPQFALLVALNAFVGGMVGLKVIVSSNIGRVV